MKNNTAIKTIVAAGIGAALFTVISLLINIPTPVPNTSIQLQYALQSLIALLFGPVAGFFSGFVGHVVKDAMAPYGLWWTWIIPSGLYGLGIGFLKNQFKLEQGIFTKTDALRFNFAQILINIIIWGGVAPLGDILVYAEAPEKVFIQGLVAGIANIVSIAIGGTLLLSLYAKSRVKTGSLSKD